MENEIKVPASASPADDLLDYVTDAVTVRDALGNVVTWNSAAEDLYGWSRAEAAGNNADALLNSRPAFDSSSLNDAGVAVGDVARVASDRRTIVVETRFKARYNADGSLAQVVETARDVTDERSARRTLQAEERRYRNLFHAMSAACFDVDLSAALDRLAELSANAQEDIRSHLLARPMLMRELIEASPIVETNERVAQIFGYAPGDGLDTLTQLWPEESHAVFVDTLLARARGIPRLTREVQLRTRAGAEVQGVLTACLAPNGVGAGRVLIGIVDTTELNQANAAAERSWERHRAIFHHMPIALCHINSDALNDLYRELGVDESTDLQALLMSNPVALERVGHSCFIEEANPQAATLLAAKSPKELSGMPIGFAWRKRPDTLSAIMAAGMARVPFEAETQIVDLDGRTVNVLFSSAAIQENGRRRSVIGMIDIDARLAAQEAFGRLQAEHAHASRISLLGELSASIAHEISQPLAAIAATGSAGLRWLDHEEPRVAQARTALDRIVTNAQRATRIIARVRQMASGRAPVMAPECIDDIVAGALQLIDAQARSKGVELRFSPAAANTLAAVDRTQIEQVVVNLVVNAIQAIDGAHVGSRSVRISTEASSGHVECLVADSGPGIHDEQIDQVFERFVTSKAEGTGLGLALCRSILNAHGGTIDVQGTSPLGGALFRFRLPVAAPLGE
jgi:PAS domain S-box-containing protein